MEAINQITDEKLKAEIVGLVQYVRRFKQEIAQMYQKQNDQTHFEGMSDQLDAIVAATEDATNTILASIEEIDAVVDQVRNAESLEEAKGLCDEINNKTIGAMEACTFQDITGQRVTKIVRSMKFVEERVEHMAAMWGRTEIAQVADSLGDAADEMSEEEALMSGPALDMDASISQDDIDKLFD